MGSLIAVHRGEIDLSPEQVGYNAARLEQLDSHFQKLIRNAKI